MKSRPGKTTISVEFDDEELIDLRRIAESDKRSVGFLIRRAVKFWVNSADAKVMAQPLDERMADAANRHAEAVRRLENNEK